jgi:hypothetical protein
VWLNRERSQFCGFASDGERPNSVNRMQKNPSSLARGLTGCEVELPSFQANRSQAQTVG